MSSRGTLFNPIQRDHVTCPLLAVMGLVKCVVKRGLGNFPGGLVVKTLHSQCVCVGAGAGMSSSPCQET